MWVLANDDELPRRFTDPRCGEFRCICSNGFEGGLNLGSAFLHSPTRWPQCFPQRDAICTNVIVRRLVSSQKQETP